MGLLLTCFKVSFLLPIIKYRVWDYYEPVIIIAICLKSFEYLFFLIFNILRFTVDAKTIAPRLFILISSFFSSEVDRQCPYTGWWSWVYPWWIPLSCVCEWRGDCHTCIDKEMDIRYALVKRLHIPNLTSEVFLLLLVSMMSN